MPNLFDLQTTADMIQTLACVAVVLETLQILVESKQYGRHGISSYALLKKSHPWMIEGWWASLLHRLCEPPCYLSLIALELASAVLVLSHLFPFLSGGFMVMIFLIHLLSCLRHQSGLDGADQMQTILFASLLLFSLPSEPFVRSCCLWFIGCQALLSYMTAGIVKVRSAAWRGGTAIGNIVQSARFRNETFAHVLRKHPLVAKALCWSVILFECAFPLLVVTGTRSCVLMLVAGIFFHLAVALVMGLNTFFWSFVATYPAIFFCAQTCQSWIISCLK
jgi:hypothetical protein